MRKLASIQMITALTPIEGKDRIELATVQGWRVIVQKGVYLVGDLCVYCEPDSLLPERPEFEFLRSKKFKVKTMKMAGVISEGICFPTSLVPDGYLLEGTNVTNVLGVKHVDEVEEEIIDAVRLNSTSPFVKKLLNNPFLKPLGNYLALREKRMKRKSEKLPSFIKKTDETRIQTMPWIFNGSDTFICREKLDGSSTTAYLIRHKAFLPFMKDKYEFGVCSRNRRLVKADKSAEKFLSVVKKYKIESALHEIIANNDWIVLQGEMIGNGVQSNPYKLDELRFYGFNLITPKGTIPCTVAETIAKAYNIPWVPTVGVITLPATVEDILGYATGNSLIEPSVIREGIVCRNYTKNISFKAVSPDYLIGKDKKGEKDI